VVADDSCPWTTATLAAGRERVQHSFVTAGIHLVDDTRASRTTPDSSPVEIAGRVADHSCLRTVPVGPAREVVQDSLMACGIHLVYDAGFRGATLASSPVEVAGRIADYSRGRPAAIGAARKAVQHRLVACRVQFVHDAPACRTTPAGSSVEIVGRVPNDSVGRFTVGPAREAIQDSLLTSGVDPEYDTAVRRAATARSSI